MNQIKRQRQDYWISLIVFALIAFGLIMIYSVSKYYSLQVTGDKTDKFFLIKQLKWAGVGLLVWIVFQNIDYRFWQKNTKFLFWATIVLFLLPLLPMIGGGGAGERWVNIGPASFQPSELGKITLILYLSGWFASRGEDLKQVQKMFVPFVLLILGIALVMLFQKDLGTLSVILIVAASILIVAGASATQLLVGGGLTALLIFLAVKIEPYRMQRVLTFLNPESSVLGSGYHIRNALIAIGSGGLWGLGFGQSKQKYLYLPEAHTDSIFAIIAEELGFVRAGLIFILFILLALRGYKIAKEAPDPFARLAACGITTWIIAQTVINIGAMMSLMPLTGVPLPFVSYGGSSLVVLLAAIGILVNISKNRVIRPIQS